MGNIHGHLIPKMKRDWYYTSTRRPYFTVGCSACSLAMLSI